MTNLSWKCIRCFRINAPWNPSCICVPLEDNNLKDFWCIDCNKYYDIFGCSECNDKECEKLSKGFYDDKSYQITGRK